MRSLRVGECGQRDEPDRDAEREPDDAAYGNLQCKTSGRHREETM